VYRDAMIDHVSIGVRDLERSKRFYEAVLGELGHRVLIQRETTVGFGKTYPEFWLNSRPTMVVDADSGTHVCLRARSLEVVEAFYRTALAYGASAEGAPGLRPEYHASYFAAFVRDPDLNRLEVVTFVQV
jgi:catechol 2,3-dioxygenase-like lactoylglutathione lyase family enzyme